MGLADPLSAEIPQFPFYIYIYFTAVPAHLQVLFFLYPPLLQNVSITGLFSIEAIICS